MIEFGRKTRQRNLEELPPLSETPDYEVLRGKPRAFMRLDQGETDSKTRLGVWRCTTGAFRCTEKGDELQLITQGQLRIERLDGSSSVFEAGDAFYTHKGEVLLWDVLQDVEKVFFTYDRDGC